MKEITKTYLIVTLDLGASASKGIYSIYSEDNSRLNKTESMVMDSEIAKVPTSLLRNAIEFNSCPEDVAWITNKVKDEEGIAVGAFAKKYAIKEEQIENVKYEFAVDKCIGFIGAIATKHRLTQSKLEVMLNLLIPSDERESKEVLEKNLINRLKKFYFRGVAIRCKLIEFNFHIEGTGGILNRIGQNQSEGKKIVALMLGHRNCSCLILDREGLYSSSIRLGYFDYIKSIRDNAIGQKFEDLEHVIPKIEREPENREMWIDSLIRGNRSGNQKEEKKKLEGAIADSRKLHWRRMWRWLETQIPDRLDEILILGGASESFRQELSKYLSWAKIDWCEDTITELQKFKSLESESLSRYVDVFSLHKQYSTLEIGEVES